MHFSLVLICDAHIIRKCFDDFRKKEQKLNVLHKCQYELITTQKQRNDYLKKKTLFFF